MKISIVTSYYNRKQQLINTLKTIKHSLMINDIEFIVVDDCSSQEHKLEDILSEYPFVKLIELKPEDKWYVNPCIPFNVGIRNATGDIIVLQNPECLHVGDLLTNISENINDSSYITYGVYSVDYETTNDISKYPFDKKYIFELIKNRIIPFNNQNYVSEGKNCWYNHSIHRPSEYHFISAITKVNMDKLNGFDERFANGIGFDDDELLFRIKKLGLNVSICNEPFGIHQWHYSENNFFKRVNNPAEASHHNSNIFNTITKNLTSCYVNQII